ncbi:hypothetical protein H1R20_g6770, partial [Candolleomyces eurysporus]
MVLSHVCQQWRHLAVAQPLLWCNIDISLPFVPLPRYIGSSNALNPAALALHRADLATYRRQLGCTKDMLSTWISRSGGCPLTFTFKSWEDSSTDYHDADSTSRSINDAIVDILCGASTRWKSADFDLGIFTPTSPFLRFSQLSPQDVPLLEKIRHKIEFLSNMNWDEPQIREQYMANIGLFGGPSIRTVFIDRPSPSPSSMSINWATVTNLDLDDPHYSFEATGRGVHFITSVFKACPHLARISMNISSPGQWQNQNDTESYISLPLKTRISLPNLTFVSIRGSPPPSGFASSLQLPSLRTLSLYCTTYTLQDGQGGSGIVEWIRNFGDTIADATFLYSNLTTAALICCFEGLPNVTSLRLFDYGSLRVRETGHPNIGSQNPENDHDIRSYQSIVNILTPKVHVDEDGHQCYCPKLQRFGLRMHDVDFTEEDLVAFVAARRDSSKPTPSALKSVIVKFNFCQRMNVREELERRNVDTTDLRLITKYAVANGRFMEPDSLEAFEDLPREDRSLLSGFWVEGSD